MQFDQISNDCKPDAEAAVCSNIRAVCLTKSIEDVWQEFQANTFSCIADYDSQVVPYLFRRHHNDAAAGRELDRVREQIPKDLLQSIRITAERDRKPV